MWSHLDPNCPGSKQRGKQQKNDSTVTIGEDALYPLQYCAPVNCFSQTLSPGSSFLPLFVGGVLLGTCWWKGSPLSAPGEAWLPRWSLCSLMNLQDWGTWCAGGLWRVLHPCATVGLWQKAKHVGALRNIFKCSWSAAFNNLREQGLLLGANHWETWASTRRVIT